MSADRYQQTQFDIEFLEPVMTSSSLSADPDLLAQRNFVESLKRHGHDFGIAHTAAFIRGIRDLGYKHTGTALDEQIDNADQAGAHSIHVLWDTAGKKPTWIAVADDGHGMEADMIRLAMAWGGTHRENDRNGFGRYGYGLPSSAVSQGRRFTVFSKTGTASEYSSVTLDLDEMSEGKYNDGHRIVIPEGKVTPLPPALAVRLNDLKFEPSSGTIVLIEKLDRLTWTTALGLKQNLVPHFAVTYRDYLRNLDIFVDGTQIKPIDPLFLTPGALYYDEDFQRAEALPEARFTVTNSEGVECPVVLRYSYMPPRFGQVDKSKERGKNNQRFRIRADNNGIIVMRNHRQIDVVGSKRGVLYFNNDDRYVGVELDFPPSLDEEFSITTSKQSVVISDRMWDKLKEHGLIEAVQQMRTKYDKEKAKLRGSGSSKAPTPSEKTMAEAEKFSKTPPSDRERLEQRGKENLERQAQKVAEKTGRPKIEVVKELQAETIERPYVVKEESSPGAPFYRVEQLGGARVVWLNTSHRFYTRVYKGQDATPRLRAAIEVMLFVIGSCEVESVDDRARFYVSERSEWSTRLETALDILDTYLSEEGAGDSTIREEEQLDDTADAAAVAA
ncbi:ATP-binding protein [Micromonospora sp. RB23]